MASTPVTMSSFDKFLKEYYLSSWIDQLNSMTTIHSMLRRKIVDFSGRKLNFPVRTRRNNSVQALALSTGSTLSTLAEAGRQGIDSGSVRPKLICGALEVAQDIIDSSRNDRGAFFSAIDFDMAGLVQDVAEFLDRVCLGQGTGKLARITSLPATTAVTVSYHRTLIEGTKVEFWTSEASGATQKWTSAVQPITVLSRTANADGSGTMTFADGNGTIISNAVATPALADNDSISAAGARTSTASIEPMGLAGIVDSSNPPLEGGSFEGIDRSAAGNTYWGGIEDTTATLSESMIQANIDRSHDDSNGDINCLVANRMTRFALYEALMTGNPRRMVNTNLVAPGILSGKLEDHHPDSHDFLFFDGRIPIVVDKYVPVDIDVAGTVSKTGTMYGLDLSSIYWALVTDLKWWDGGQGTVLRPSTSRKFGLEAVLYMLGNIVCDAPRKNWKNESLVIG